MYYNTCYTSPFLNKSGSPLVCFHPLLTFRAQCNSNKIDQAKNKTTLIEHRQHYVYEIMCIPIGKVYVR